MKLRRCQDRFRPDVSVGFIIEHEQLLEKVSLQVGKLLIGQTGPHFRRPVAFKFCSVCLFVCPQCKVKARLVLDAETQIRNGRSLTVSCLLVVAIHGNAMQCCLLAVAMRGNAMHCCLLAVELQCVAFQG